MSYSRRQLYAMGEPLGDSATYRKADGGLVLGGGGGGGGGSPPAATTQTTTQELPEWARPYAQDVLAKGAALTDINTNPYQVYGGERVAPFSNLQKQSFQGAQNLGPNALSVYGGLNALNAGQDYQNMATDPSAVSQYMSPYISNVLNNQIAASNRGYDISAQNARADATKAGAYGGSRGAIMQAENERARNAANQGIVASGLQNAFQNAQQSQQFGANLGLQGSQAAVGAGQNVFGQQQNAIATQNQMGGQQQQQYQKALDIAQQDFLNQQNYPYKQLGFMSDLIRGTPIGMQSTNQVYQAGPSTAQNIASLGLGAAGIASLARAAAGGGLMESYADGGSVQGYADGGDISPMHDEQAMAADVSKLSDQQLQQVLQHPTTQAEFQAAQQEMAFRASMRNGLAGTVTPQMVQKMAGGGGVLAFAGDDEENDPQTGQLISRGDPRAYSNFNSQLLASMEAIRGFKPKGMSEKDYNDAISNRYEMLGNLAGPDPYAEQAKQYDEQAKGLSGIGDLGRATGFFKAAQAVAQGNNLVRGLAGAGAAYGEEAAKAAQAERLEKRSLNNARLNILDAQRKERMGMTRDAVGAADDARRSVSDANKYEIEKQKALGTMAAAGARAAKPIGGGGGAAKPPKLPERLYDANLANLMSTEKPAAGESDKAFQNRINAKAGELTARQVKDIGQNRVTMEGEKLTSKEDAAIADKLDKFRFSPDYLGAKDKETALDNYEMAQRRLYRRNAGSGNAVNPSNNVTRSNF